MGHLITEKQWQAGPLSEAAQPTGASRELLVIVVEDTPVLSRTIGFLCDYLGIRVETVPSHASLEELLPAKRPMAVMSPIDTPAQDGCHVLKTVADYDRSLPVLLVTGTDSRLARGGRGGGRDLEARPGPKDDLHSWHRRPGRVPFQGWPPQRKQPDADLGGLCRWRRIRVRTTGFAPPPHRRCVTPRDMLRHRIRLDHVPVIVSPIFRLPRFEIRDTHCAV